MNNTLQNQSNHFAQVDFSVIKQYICPLCQSPLTINNKVWHCDGSLNSKHTKHSFDVARQGYINLLPVQFKKSKNSGDSGQSVQARHDFLHNGFYQPLQALIVQVTNQFTADNSHWLDIGCGEGYYSQAIYSSEKVSQLTAVDISKSAVVTLSKSCKIQHNLWSQKENGIVPMVASASQLPLADNSVQAISSIFSPIFADEFARVLAPNGILMVVKPDIDHLASVRQGLFDTVRKYEVDKFSDQLQASGFSKIHQQKLSYKIELDSDNVANLLTMTPYSYRAKKEKRQALLENCQKNGLLTQVAFVVDIFRLG